MVNMIKDMKMTMNSHNDAIAVSVSDEEFEKEIVELKA